MDVMQFYWGGERGLIFKGKALENPDLVFYFFDKAIVDQIDCYQLIKDAFPKASLIGISTSGPILDEDIYMGSITGSALKFEHTPFKAIEIACPDQDHSFAAGKECVEKLLTKDLRHILVITDGLTVNGDQFAKGANQILPLNVTLSGGLASDALKFEETLTGINRKPVSGNICAIGFYGPNINISTAAEGGWDCFGVERRVTKSNGTYLYELDGMPAIDLYKEYLGPEVDHLPSSGLLFPLAVREDDSDEIFVRTINAVDDENQLLRFTGEIPEGYIVQFMKGKFKNLAVGAGISASKAMKKNKDQGDFAMAISCIGRQLLLGQRIGDELEAVKDAFHGIPVSGFYSNGELSYSETHKSLLHNETMTVTLFKET